MSDITEKLRNTACDFPEDEAMLDEAADEIDRLRAELDLVIRQFKYAQKVVANLNEQIDALRKQEPACVIDVNRHGDGVLVAGSLDRGIHNLYASPVPPPAVAVPDGFVLVPKEPTMKMLDSVAWILQDAPSNAARVVWSSMLDAAQTKST